MSQHDQDYKNKYHYKRRQKAAESILENQHESGNGIPTVEELQILRQLCILINELIQLGNRDTFPVCVRLKYMQHSSVPGQRINTSIPDCLDDSGIIGLTD